jgi:RNA polymerase sigma factor (TIGR02999 family)
MYPAASGDSITRCLRQVQLGQTGAEERLLNLVYGHLRKMAGQRMRRERADHTLQPTALANEVYLRLIQTVKNIEWKDSDHFYATCGRVMRNILVDYARRRKYEKVDLEFIPGVAITEERSEQLLALDQCLDRLAAVDPRGARVIELTSFGGLTQAEVAEVLGVSERTVKRDYQACRTWLRAEMAGVRQKDRDEAAERPAD